MFSEFTLKMYIPEPLLITIAKQIALAADGEVHRRSESGPNNHSHKLSRIYHGSFQAHTYKTKLEADPLGMITHKIRSRTLENENTRNKCNVSPTQ